jgi:hypothetical protein
MPYSTSGTNIHKKKHPQMKNTNISSNIPFQLYSTCPSTTSNSGYLKPAFDSNQPVSKKIREKQRHAIHQVFSTQRNPPVPKQQQKTKV